MRPGRLTVEGLACFKDKQVIDLTPLDLFAISGPTGAGKSTLLDAMTIALYGVVPRVTIQNRSEMISASRDRVSVVLDFDVGPDRYRIARTLRQSGGHNVRLEKHDGQDFNVNLADQVRTASEKVVEILGLDATAFMQAVVLPRPHPPRSELRRRVALPRDPHRAVPTGLCGGRGRARGLPVLYHERGVVSSGAAGLGGGQNDAERGSLAGVHRAKHGGQGRGIGFCPVD